MAAPSFIRIRVSPAKAAINSDRAIAEELTGAWLPCQESSAFRSAQSNYPLKAESSPVPSFGRLSSKIREVIVDQGPLPRLPERRLGLVEAVGQPRRFQPGRIT